QDTGGAVARPGEELEAPAPAQAPTAGGVGRAVGRTDALLEQGAVGDEFKPLTAPRRREVVVRAAVDSRCVGIFLVGMEPGPEKRSRIDIPCHDSTPSMFGPGRGTEGRTTVALATGVTRTTPPYLSGYEAAARPVKGGMHADDLT